MIKYFAYNKENAKDLYVNSLINSEKYYGYYNVSTDGKVYKTKDKQTSPLSCTNNIEDELNKSQFYKDRVLSEDLTLPYSLNDILIGVNEPVKASVLNNTINKLYDNLLYIYSNCYIANNIIPNNFKGWFGCPRIYKNKKYEVGEFKWNLPTSPIPSDFSYKEEEVPSNSININLINNIRDAVVFKNNDIFYLFAITTNVYVPLGSDYNADRLVCFKIETTATGYKIQQIINTFYIDDKASQDIDTFDSNGNRKSDLTYSNDLVFKNLKSIACDNNRFLYVLDSIGNHVYVYDVYGIINNDKLFNNRLLLYKILGDDDALGDSNIKFISPTTIKSYENKLFVIDPGDDSIKIFDSDLNWYKTIGNLNFKNQIPADFVYDNVNNCYYILTIDGTIIKYDVDFYDNIKISTNIVLSDDEQCIKMYISYNNSNVMYILTTRNIYKKFITKLEKNIGTFLFHQYNVIDDKTNYWNYNTNLWEQDTKTWYIEDLEDDLNYFDITIKCLAFCPNTVDYDDIFVVINSRILICQEDINYYSLFTTTNEYTDYVVDFDLYNKDDILIDDEYVQALTYNKMLYKINKNIDILYEKIGFYPIANYDNYNNLIIKTLDYCDLNSNYDLGLKIYDNENVNINTINRIITLIYNKLEYLLDKIQTKRYNYRLSLTNELFLN